MIRKTVLGFAAAASFAIAMAATASTASAGANVSFHFGGPVFGYGYHAPYGYYGYGAPIVSFHSCPKVFVGYEKVMTHYGWEKRPIYRRHCGY